MKKRAKIQNKLLCWFLAVTLIPLTIISALSYLNASKIVKEEVSANLLALSKNKADTIHTYLNEKKTDLLVISRLPMLSEAVKDYETGFTDGGLHSPGYMAVDNKFRESLNSIKETFGFHDLFLITRAGDVVFTVAREDDLGTNLLNGTYKETELAKAFKYSSSMMEPANSSLKMYPPSAKPAMFIVIPVFDKDVVSGILAAQLNNSEFNAIAADHTGLGTTGETVIASTEWNGAMMLTPIRSDASAAFNRVVPYNSDIATPIQKALGGGRGVGLSHDYRGVEVLAAWRYFPHHAWGIVVKIDADEAFSSVRLLLRNLLLITGGATICVILISVAISRTIAMPIVAITKTADAIASGDIAKKANVVGNDEITILAGSFNHMLKELNLAQEDIYRKKEEIEGVNLDLERKVDELDEFTYVASHDLQEPLRKITNFSDLLRTDVGTSLSNRAERDLYYIQDASQRMKTLIQDLLSLSRSGREEMDFEIIPLDNCVDSALVALDESIKASNTRIDRSFKLPEVYGDRTMLTLLYQNLIGNAIKYNEGSCPIITLTSKETDEGMVLGVKDNGIGIKADYLEQIFAPFKRLHGIKEYGGSGIGLSICKKIVERHGGRLWVESEPGIGSHFFFTTSTDERGK